MNQFLCDSFLFFLLILSFIFGRTSFGLDPRILNVTSCSFLVLSKVFVCTAGTGYKK